MSLWHTLVVLIVDRRPELKKRHFAQAPELLMGRWIEEDEEL
jgi:hypothetical protein